MRLFVALEIPDTVRAAVSEFSAELRRKLPHARWVRLQGAHITLKFIGEVSPERSEQIRAALENIRAIGPFDLCLRGTGFFPEARRPRFLWVGIEGGAPLTELASAIEDRLTPLGIARETRAFHPHLTLARLDGGAVAAALRDAVTERPEAEFGRARVNQFCLYQSILKSGGAEYTRLAVYSLAGEQTL